MGCVMIILRRIWFMLKRRMHDKGLLHRETYVSENWMREYTRTFKDETPYIIK